MGRAIAFTDPARARRPRSRNAWPSDGPFFLDVVRGSPGGTAFPMIAAGSGASSGDVERDYDLPARHQNRAAEKPR